MHVRARNQGITGICLRTLRKVQSAKNARRWASRPLILEHRAAGRCFMLFPLPSYSSSFFGAPSPAVRASFSLSVGCPGCGDDWRQARCASLAALHTASPAAGALNPTSFSHTDALLRYNMFFHDILDPKNLSNLAPTMANTTNSTNSTSNSTVSAFLA